MNRTALLPAPPIVPRQIIPPARHTRASLRTMLDRLVTGETRRFVAELHGLHLCEGWLGGAGFCLRTASHDGGCLPIPAGYAPAEVA